MKPNHRTFVLLSCALIAVLFAMRTLRSQRVKASLQNIEAKLPSAAASAAPVVDSAPNTATSANEARRAADRVRALLAERRRAQAAQAPSPSASMASRNAAAPTMPMPAGSGNQANQALGAYVRDVMRKQFFPLASSCYANLLEHKPGVSGRLVLDVRIVGDSSVGGVVDSVELAADSNLRDEELLTCVRESMYAVQFDAPPGGQGEVTFTFPLTLSPSPPASSAPSERAH